MSWIFRAFGIVVLLARAQGGSLPDAATMEAFKTVIASPDFPREIHPKITRAALERGTEETLELLNEAFSVYRVDFNKDGLVDCVVSVSWQARNQQFFVLQRLRNGWKIVGQVIGKEFSFLRFVSSAAADLEVWLSTGPGNQHVSRYRFANGAYREVEKRTVAPE